MTDLLAKGMNATHRVVLAVSGGRFGRSFGTMKTVELHTVGRKSGKPRATMLTAPISDDRQIVLIASKGGDDRDPDWYRNLVAEPDVELTVDGLRLPYRARTATPAEKVELWPKVVAAYAGYAGYQRRTQRDIPVVICEPR